MKDRLQNDAIYETMFKTYYRQLFCYAYGYVNNTEIAADITNDVFCDLWAKYRHSDMDASLLPWLYTLIRNHCIDYLRHKEAEQRYQISLELSDLYENSMMEITMHEEKINQIMKRIELLPPQTRMIFNECFMNNRKYKEVAEELDISINTVKTYIARALQFLREKKCDDY